MKSHVISALALSAVAFTTAKADPLSLQPDRYASAAHVAPRARVIIAEPVAPAPVEVERAPVARYAANNSEVNLGGGFIEYLFSGGRSAPPRPPSAIQASAAPYEAQPETMRAPVQEAMDPRYLKQVVAFTGREKPGTIIIDTPHRFLFLVQDNGTALRYGIGVGKPGFTWAGEKTVSAKKEWPDWTPPPEMLERRPDLPHFMAGGPENPLGARALYLGSSLYRIHGSNEPWTIGQAVSSGCIRMRNQDVIDLYERVRVGTKVVVM
jgi:lipoprotein-anchoring transpeptidase ErfK/SrfK